MSESDSTASSNSSEGASASSVQGDLNEPERLEKRCPALSESECVAPPLSASHVTKSPRTSTDAPPKPASQSVATQTTSMEETEGAFVKGDTKGRVETPGKEEKGRSGGPSGVGEAIGGLSQATSKKACGESLDGSKTITGENTSGNQGLSLRLESQEPSSSTW